MIADSGSAREDEPGLLSRALIIILALSVLAVSFGDAVIAVGVRGLEAWVLDRQARFADGLDREPDRSSHYARRLRTSRGSARPGGAFGPVESELLWEAFWSLDLRDYFASRFWRTLTWTIGWGRLISGFGGIAGGVALLLRRDWGRRLCVVVCLVNVAASGIESIAVDRDLPLLWNGFIKDRSLAERDLRARIDLPEITPIPVLSLTPADDLSRGALAWFAVTAFVPAFLALALTLPSLRRVTAARSKALAA